MCCNECLSECCSLFYSVFYSVCYSVVCTYNRSRKCMYLNDVFLLRKNESMEKDVYIEFTFI